MTAICLPGPLTARKPTGHAWEIIGPLDSSLTGIPTRPLIARVTATYYEHGMAEKFAHLFTSSPELLESIVPLLEWAIEANSRLEYQKYNGMQLGGNPEANPIFKAAKAAIAKAEGRE